MRRVHGYIGSFFGLILGLVTNMSCKSQDSTEIVVGDKQTPESDVRHEVKQQQDDPTPPEPVVRPELAKAGCPEGMTNEVEGFEGNHCMDSAQVLFKDYEAWCLRSSRCSYSKGFQEKLPRCLRFAEDDINSDEAGECSEWYRGFGMCSLKDNPFEFWCPASVRPYNYPNFAKEYCKDMGKVACNDNFANGALKGVRRKLGFRCCSTLE